MKLLIIGLGGIGQKHLRNLRRKFGDEVEILGYSKGKKPVVLTDNLEVEEGANLEEKYNIKVFDSMKDALQEKPGVAFICTPTSLHVPQAIEAAKAGCHLFIEKPLSHSMENIEDLRAISQRNKLIVSIGFQLRFNPVLKLLREEIKNNVIGDILSVHVDVGDWLPGWHKYENYQQLYASKKDLGGGVVLTQIHEFDYLYWFFGMPEKVYTLGGKLSDLEIDVEDTIDTLLQMSFRGRMLPVSVHMDYLQRPTTRICKVIGTNGNMIMDLVKTTLVISKPDEREKRYQYPDFERNQMYIDEIDHFFNCIDRDSNPLVNLEEGINSLKIALAVKDSLLNNRKVDLIIN